MPTKKTLKKKAGLTYADTGVSIEAGDAMVGRIQSHLHRTHGPRVLGRNPRGPGPSEPMVKGVLVFDAEGASHQESRYRAKA